MRRIFIYFWLIMKRHQNMKYDNKNYKEGTKYVYIYIFLMLLWYFIF